MTKLKVKIKIRQNKNKTTNLHNRHINAAKTQRDKACAAIGHHESKERPPWSRGL